MNRTILLAIGGLALGLALAIGGTLLLGAARAAAKGGQRRLRADLKQYAAVLGALIGFLLTAAGGGLLARELLPITESARTVAAAGVAVLLFTAAGVIFSRVADSAEEKKAQQLSPEIPQSPAPPPATAAESAPEELGDLARAGSVIPDAATLLRGVRPGWIYRDTADRWYLGVVDEHTRNLPLIRLPDFALVAADEPTYPLTVAGAGEIAVVPLPTASSAPGNEEAANR